MNKVKSPRNFGMRYTKSNGKVRTDWYLTQEAAERDIKKAPIERKAHLIKKSA